MNGKYPYFVAVTLRSSVGRRFVHPFEEIVVLEENRLVIRLPTLHVNLVHLTGPLLLPSSFVSPVLVFDLVSSV